MAEVVLYVEYYSEKKNPYLSTNEEFFQKVINDSKHYFGYKDKNECLVFEALQKDDTLTNVELAFAKRAAVCLQEAYSRGHCLVRWEKLLQLPSYKLYEHLNTHYNYIKKNFPEIIQKFDEVIKKQKNGREK